MTPSALVARGECLPAHPVKAGPRVVHVYPPRYAARGSDGRGRVGDWWWPLAFCCRFCEARVWSLLNPICGGCLDGHLDYVQGYNLSNAMPLFVPVASKLTVNDTFHHMRNHFEGMWYVCGNGCGGCRKAHPFVRSVTALRPTGSRTMALTDRTLARDLVTRLTASDPWFGASTVTYFHFVSGVCPAPLPPHPFIFRAFHHFLVACHSCCSGPSQARTT